MFKKKNNPDNPQTAKPKTGSVTGAYQVVFDRLEEEMKKMEDSKNRAKDVKETARQTISGIFRAPKAEPT